MHATGIAQATAVTVLAAGFLLLGFGVTAGDVGIGARDAGVRSVAGAALPGNLGGPGAVVDDFGWQ
ncbi:hypothetical protein ACWCPF_00875 [Streptomyces sp. NPDC001858]